MLFLNTHLSFFDMKNLFLSTLFFFLSTLILFAQQSPILYEIIQKDTNYVFPVFVNKKNPEVAEKINQTIQIAELELLKGFEKENIFERVSNPENWTLFGRRVLIESSVMENNNKVLAIKIKNSSCGLTCSHWVNYYNFNVENGDVIQLKDLFTEDGFSHFLGYATEKQVNILKEEAADNILLYDNIITCYRANNLYDFFIKGDSLFINGEDCFLKNELFPENINTVTKFNLTEFKHFLSDYGKIIFSLKKGNLKKQRSQSLPQLFEGSIAGKEVLFVIRNIEGKEVIAEYADKQNGIGIYLEGKLDEKQLSLIEKDAENNDNGYIDAEFDKDKISGIWKSKDGTNLYRVSLKRK